MKGLYEELSKDVDFEAAAAALGRAGEHELAEQIRRLRDRLQRGVAVTASDLDIETILAVDIIRGLRGVLKCRPEDAIMVRAENVMEQLDVLQAPYREKAGMGSRALDT